MNRIRASKFMSLVLRHQPERIGLTLNRQGWVEVAELVRRSQAAKVFLTASLIHEVVEHCEKQRFSLSADGREIRANQGHSIAVDLGLPKVLPLLVLFHGTATRFLDGIFKVGLQPGRRQHVHLSPDLDTAVKVGRRHGKVVVLEVAALKMHQAGGIFMCAANGVWLTAKVAPRYLKLLE